MVPEIDLSDPSVLRDPFTAYGEARERAVVARLPAPGFGTMWAVLRHEEARAMLGDPRFSPGPGSYQRLDVPEHCRPYLRTMQEVGAEEHLRLRRTVAPAFAPRRAEEFRPRVERIVAKLLGELPSDTVDLLPAFARPLPIEVICEMAGIDEADRPRWHSYGAAIAAGAVDSFASSIPNVIEDAKAALAAHRIAPADDLVTDLLGAELTSTETITLIWHLVLAGQTPANLITNAVETLLAHPDQLAALRADPAAMPGAVEELLRWCGPQLFTIPRFAGEDAEIGGVRIPRGEPVTVAIAAVNRDPRAFDDPGRFDLTRRAGAGHLSFAHGPHFCLGAAFARVQMEVALSALFRRFPGLRVADLERAPDPGTWRLTTLRLEF
ncbi:cytochrome P450 [Amycolatopsis alkalitolerans]|uniref:Cytochrome P450 n=1 Tax=Amycolatopsis alkalitolerans TaxID=2547244 RepID=A0A5C4LWG0_9PSEU|nr:cytochrome P450 [Amycolatopsis alkalitolerans]TNC23540.1 cytochrome P450 [Amycolatopsis alkalitolerans]